ncbi:MAG: diacylglycerol/lipid kinase family protein [Vicinamibacteria bacterium]
MPRRDLPLVIVNPASRGGKGASEWPSAASALRTHFGPFECRFTGARGDASSIAREEAARGRALLVTFGGDGTISETVQGILQSEKSVELGILPHGTGGDLVRSLPLPTRLGDAARALRRGKTVRVDVGRVVFGDGSEKTFINAASFGVSAEVALRMNQQQGGSHYLSETLKAAAKLSYPEIEVAIDAGPFRSVRSTSLSIHNGRYFGGGMKMAPEASLTDGLLDVVVVKKLSLAKLVRESPRLYFGAHLGLPEVEHRKVKTLEARPVRDDSIRVEIDGEADLLLPARFEVLPAALSLRV